MIDESTWSSLASAIVGGFIAGVASFWATKAQLNEQREARKQELEQLEAEKAYLAFRKLLDAYNLAYNLKVHIDEQFEEADQLGDSRIDPWSKVRELVGSRRFPKEIDPSETIFFIPEKKADLLNEVHIVIHRVESILESAQAYNKLRSEMQSFLESNISADIVVDGTAFSAKYPEELRPRVLMREGTMNNLLGQLMENLKEDVPRAWEATAKFQEAAKERFGDKFPTFKLEKIRA